MNTCDELKGKTLILTVGLPRSGKTTWARVQGCPIVNPDSIRLALHGQRFVAKAEQFVWAIAYTMVEALFLAGHNKVIVDATNVSRARRDEWVKRFDQKCTEEATPEQVAACNHVEFHIVPTSVATCVRRAKSQNDEEIIPVIHRMAADWDLEQELDTEEAAIKRALGET